jgi:hypothetical protein
MVEGLGLSAYTPDAGSAFLSERIQTGAPCLDFETWEPPLPAPHPHVKP